MSSGLSSPYWTLRSRERAAWSAASSHRPAQISTHARFQRARALRGSSRSRQSSYSRCSRRRAASLLRHEMRTAATAKTASSRSFASPAAVAKLVRPRRVTPEPRRPRRNSRWRHRERLDPSSVVVLRIGQRQGGARVVERRDAAAPEARRPRQPALHDRPQPRRRGRLRQGFLEQRDGTIAALELGEEDESLGPQRADLRLGEQVDRDRAGARPLAGGLMRASRGQRPAMALVGAPGGVSRSACSASSAATAGAPRSAASLAASSSAPATPASGVSVESAR